MEKFRNLIYVEDANLIFAYVPKVACTNWKCLLRKSSGLDNYLDAGLAHDRENSGLTYLNKRQDSREIVSNPEISKFSFVRNPYTRILSAYLNKVDKFNKMDVKNDPYFEKVYREIADFNDSQAKNVTFVEFLRWLKSATAGKSFGHYDEHWRLQSTLICIDEVNYDFIGKFEKLAEDSTVIMRALKLDSMEFPTQKAVKFPPTGASQKVDNYYDNECIELVKEMFAMDFEKLGYSLDFDARKNG